MGLAECEITPPEGFPMAGYYHERLAEGTIDPLKARAVVFRDGDQSAALVVCDLIGIATDLSREVRRQASANTGIPAEHIILSATHSHTAPDYMKELWLVLGDSAEEKSQQQPARAAYIQSLINNLTAVIAEADRTSAPVLLQYGTATQATPVSFNRRFVMRDGSVRTWQNLKNPEVVRAAGPIDPTIGLLKISDTQSHVRGVISNFALHLDTVGGSRWSADYPFFIERTLQGTLGPDVISVFGTGCCGDINHVNPAAAERNTAAVIGTALGDTIVSQLDQLQTLPASGFRVKTETVLLPLQEATADQVRQSIAVLDRAKQHEKVDFFEHVTAYKKLILDQMRHASPAATTSQHITWGLSRSLAGVGDALPVDVTVMTFGSELAIVCLPGEVFVELGLAIKQASPFRQTMVIELSNAVETIYVPHRAAYAGGSYEVTNSALQPGGGEVLVETALRLLRENATVTQQAGSPAGLK
ncbi:MAG: neutral/alkaline non-lysosomal ceramidase N-terminal domain-containing protein [Planctomycetaceae bacterium]|nr:neutral/alkaline non-lysosomal ceramidase N-terminal domain-containing protein [Planctomycetaceae bacterium]